MRLSQSGTVSYYNITTTNEEAQKFLTRGIAELTVLEI